MNCAEYRDLLELYALGVLDESERTELESHLGDGCQTCAGELEQAKMRNAAVLESLAPSIAPPPRLRRRILAAVGVETAQQPSWIWFPWAVAALAVVLLVADVAWLRPQEASRASDQFQREIGVQQAESAKLRNALDAIAGSDVKQVAFGPGAGNPPRGRAFVSAQRGIVLLAANLPKLSAGRAFQLWTLPRQGNPRSAGVFQATAEGATVYTYTGAIAATDLKALAISVEPVGGSPQPTTTPILIAPL